MTPELILSLAGIIISLAFMVIAVLRGVNIIIITLVATLITSLTSRLPIIPAITSSYAGGIGSMMTTICLLFVCSCTLSKVCEKVGSTNLLGTALGKVFGPKHAVLALVIIGTLSSYGGLGFGGRLICYGIGLKMFKKANYSRYMLPGILIFAGWTYAMTCPFAPDTMNFLPTQYLGTNTRACLIPGMAAALTMFVVGTLYLDIRTKRLSAKGEGWEGDVEIDEVDETAITAIGLIKALAPILVVFITYNFFSFPIPISMLLGAFTFTLLDLKKFSFKEWLNIYSEGAMNGISPAFSMSVIAGYAAVVATTPFYNYLLANLSQMQMNPYLLAIIVPGAVAAMLSSGTNAMVLSLQSFAPFFLGFSGSYSMGAIHRLMSISAGVFDSLPINGTINSMLALWNSPYKKSYPPIFVTTCLIPLLGLVVCYILVMMGLG